MKIIFLDIDGVLNNFSTLHKFDLDDPAEMLDPLCVSNLNKIIEKSSAKVVISSSWRFMHHFEDLAKILEKKGFKGEVIDQTPEIFYIRKGEEACRGDEIEDWIKNSKEPIEAFVILDDDSDMRNVKNRLVQTSMDTGLTEKHLEAALVMLELPV